MTPFPPIWLLFFLTVEDRLCHPRDAARRLCQRTENEGLADGRHTIGRATQSDITYMVRTELLTPLDNLH